MISFDEGVKEKLVLRIFKRIFVGMSAPDFMDTEVARTAKICNLKIDDQDFMINIHFDCVYGAVSIQHSTISTMSVNLLEAPIQERLSVAEREAFSYQSTGDEDVDYTALMDMLNRLGREHPEQFRLNNQLGCDYPNTAIYASHQSFIVVHKGLADLLINKIGAGLGLINTKETEHLCDLFALVETPIHREHLNQLFASQFDTFFELLKTNKHTADNQFVFNDVDNFLHYMVSRDGLVQGIVARSQNNMFFYAKHVETGVIKIWNTIKIFDENDRDILYEVADGKTLFDGAQYMCSMLFSKYGQKYWYHCEFENNQHRKSPSTLIEAFDDDSFNAHLIYSSDAGFYPAQHIKFESCISDLDFAFEVLTTEYNVEYTYPWMEA
jgi:hypothetical protein